jgi:hypothetical protein
MPKNQRWIVWIKEKAESGPYEWGPWQPNGDGPMTEREAQRIAKEIRQDCGVKTWALPAGMEPNQ